MTEFEVEVFKEMWTTQLDDHWLIPSDSTFHYGIFEISSRSFVIIEENELYRAVIHKLLEAGARIATFEEVNSIFDS